MASARSGERQLMCALEADIARLGEERVDVGR